MCVCCQTRIVSINCTNKLSRAYKIDELYSIVMFELLTTHSANATLTIPSWLLTSTFTMQMATHGNTSNLRMTGIRVSKHICPHLDSTKKHAVLIQGSLRTVAKPSPLPLDTGAVRLNILCFAARLEGP